MVKTYVGGFWLILSLTASLTAENRPIGDFDASIVTIDEQRREIRLADLEIAPQANGWAIPVDHRYLRLSRDLFDALQAGARTVPLTDIPLPPPTATSSENRYNHIQPDQPTQPWRWHILAEHPDSLDVRLSLFPVVVIESRFRLVERVDFMVGDTTVDLRQFERQRATGTALSSPFTSDSREVLIVTSPRLLEAAKTYARYRELGGFAVRVETVDDAITDYAGRDDAERLQHRMRDYVHAGGRYVFLIGDQNEVPTRLLSHANRIVVGDTVDLIPGDFYYAAPFGEWDADNDGSWGEPYDDQPILTPQLLVGRLPTDDSASVTRYLEAVRRYECAALADLDYLQSTVFFASDQMRDGPGDGQHDLIAQSFPAAWRVDTALTVEQASGTDPQPTNLSARQLTQGHRLAAGIFHVLAHGRPDAFTVWSSGINAWPKSYLITGTVSHEHGSVDSVGSDDQPGWLYSLACDNGGYELDDYFGSAGPSIAERMLGRGQLVGMVGYSRWGWVSLSWHLQRACIDSLFAHPGRPAIEAMYRSHGVVATSRDLIYGQNYFGDPSVSVWTDRPQALPIQVTVENATIHINPLSSATVSSSLTVSIATADQPIQSFVIGAAGGSLPVSIEPGGELDILVSTDEFAPHYARFRPDIATDVDNDATRPTVFALIGNYPNPFNPTTTISFSLDRSTPVELVVTNLLGQRVRTLVDRRLTAGHHDVHWDGRDESGSPVATGIYFTTLETISGRKHHKMLLIR